MSKTETEFWKKNWHNVACKGVKNITRLLSLDSSSSKTGWAIFDDANYTKSGVIDLDTKECKKKYKGNSENRIEDMCLHIIRIIDKCKPDIIVIEKLNVGRNMVAVRCLSKVIGAVYCYSILNNIFYFEIQPSQWRSQLGMQSTKRKREDYKKLSVEYVEHTLGIQVSDDESDSICAGIGYIKMFVQRQ